MKSSIVIMTIFLAAAAFGAMPHTNNVVVPISAAPQLLIPAAGSTPGGFNTFFRSDIAIINFASHDQQVKLQWLPQGGGSGSTTIVTIAAQSGIRASDFVATYLKQPGRGAIIITGVTSSGANDSSALLSASSRIWTPQPGTTGTTSQSLPAVPTNALFTGTSAAFFAVGGADNPSNYRVNIGIVNMASTSQTFAISLPGSGTPLGLVIIPAMAMAQVSLGNGISPTQQVLVQNAATATQSNLWIAYASTIDNVTGDAWSELAIPGQ